MKPPTRKFLIVTADDFGLHESVNEAIEQGSRAGILTAASLMIGEKATQDAICRAHTLPNLRVGLHLVLADGWPTSAAGHIPALINADGRMDSDMLRKSARFFMFSQVRMQMEAEIRAQFTAFAKTGLTLDHVNVHKHFHFHPNVLSVLLRVGREFGLRAVRLPREPLWFAMRARQWLPGLQGAMLTPWLAHMKRQLRAAGVFHNDQIFGIAATGAMDECTLLKIVAGLPMGVTEIYLHPATQSGNALSPSMGRYRHAAEFAALLSSRVRTAIEQSNVVVGGFADAARAVRKRALP